jgi:uncharacterized protein YbjT (DUF2867 family)
MRVIIFGASGMIGQGVLRECLLDPGVEEVLLVGRSASGVSQEKVRELVQPDLLHYDAVEAQLSGFDACFFCLGVSSSGMKEADYERITYGIATAAAATLARLNPQMTFLYVSGAGTDSTEKGRSMWARVKGRTENALLRLPFRAAYMFRPGFIVPLHGIRSKTRVYQLLYSLTRPLWPLLLRAFPNQITTTEQIGRAMIRAARYGAPKPILEAKDIIALASSPAPN